MVARLAGEEKAVFERERRALEETAADLAQLAPPQPPPAALRDRVLAATAAGLPPVAGGLFLRAADLPWVEGKSPGYRDKILSGTRGGPGPEIRLMQMDPGARVADHQHRRTEEVYLLSGNLHSNGHLARAGDFLRNEVGSPHEDVWSPDGCLALLILGPVAA